VRTVGASGDASPRTHMHHTHCRLCTHTCRGEARAQEKQQLRALTCCVDPRNVSHATRLVANGALFPDASPSGRPSYNPTPLAIICPTRAPTHACLVERASPANPHPQSTRRFTTHVLQDAVQPTARSPVRGFTPRRPWTCRRTSCVRGSRLSAGPFSGRRRRWKHASSPPRQTG